jgi:hypothetical protein
MSAILTHPPRFTPCSSAQVMILHNNWIKGIRAKIARVIEKKLWFYDREKEICNYEPRPTFRFDWSLDDGGEE